VLGQIARQFGGDQGDPRGARTVKPDAFGQLRRPAAGLPDLAGLGDAQG
jgi:hypothetical protein